QGGDPPGGRSRRAGVVRGDAQGREAAGADAPGPTAPGPHPRASEPARAHGAQAADEAWTAAVQAAESDHRAGVRPDQGVSGDRPVPAAWPGAPPARGEADLRDAQ